MPPPLPIRLPPPLPRRMPPPLPVPMAKPVVGGNAPMQAGGAVNPLSGQPQVKYGRLANPHTGVVSGEWVRIQSTWLWAIKFIPYAQPEDAPEQMVTEQVGDFYIEFNDGFIAKWSDFRYVFYKSYLDAPSKGRFHYRAPWKSSYTMERPQIYFDAALEQRIESNT